MCPGPGGWAHGARRHLLAFGAAAGSRQPAALLPAELHRAPLLKPACP